jgi:6-phosphogluconolactonase
MDILVGTYSSPTDESGDSSKGIYAVFFDPSDGAFGTPRLVFKSLNPSYLLLSPDAQILFAVREVFKDDMPVLSSFRIEPSTKLVKLSEVPLSGELPCHLAFDPVSQRLASAQYWTGDIALCDVKNGQLGAPTSILNLLATGPELARQDGPHAHCVAFTDEGTVLHVVDLGTDSLTSHRLGAGNEPVENTVLHLPAGCGPRHIAINKSATRAFLFCELDESLIVLDRSGLGWIIASVQPGFAAPDGELGSGAAIRLSADERHVYISGRRQSRVACFAADASVSTIGEYDTGGASPRDFILTADGSWLIIANQDSGTLKNFRRDTHTGSLTASGHDCAIHKPVCLVAMPE